MKWLLAVVTAWPLLVSAKPIRLTEAVIIGGIQQWIDIRSVNDTLPVLLFLHGGPGNSVMGYAGKFTQALQKHFVVVQWDQRESGKTARLNVTPVPLTLAVMESDASEMVEHLRGRFSKEKILLVGHSWGGFLALRVAGLHPEWLSACVAVAPMVNQWESERQTLDWLLDKARKDDNKNAIGELEKVHVPFRSPEELYYHRRWLAVANNNDPVSRNHVLKWGEKWFGLYLEACGVNFFEQSPEYTCPVYFFLGLSDRQASSAISEAYYRKLSAEKKGIYWFTKSGHSLNLTEPNLFQETILSLRTR
jgi:pimeloyl-ACP methyl ester carboxylesterase